MSKQSKKNSVRIIAGDWRGRKLPVIDLPGLRPTTDRVRETLFNWLMHELYDTQCLDLFAGSGALGFESLSRGASYVQFVESSHIAAAAIQNSLELLKLNRASTRAQLQQSDALRFLARPASMTFGLVFLDPPFQSNLIERAADLLEANSWLSDDATIYIECDASKSLADLPANWLIRKQGKFGQSAFYLFQRAPK